MIRAECAASGKPLFDLASAESSRADGKSAVRLYRGEAYLSLRGDFTTDGGHLNEVGRKVAAERLLASLIAVE
jgi:lysophospholipase L1-like esterase